MSSIHVRAIDGNSSSQRIYSEMTISTEITGDDISEFIIHLIEQSTTSAIKLEFIGDDDCSGILTVPVTIPTEKNSDNGDAPIHTIMSQESFNALYYKVREEMANASMSIAFDCRAEGDDDSADQFFEIAYTLERIE